jgi:hypothetical protein
VLVIALFAAVFAADWSAHGWEFWRSVVFATSVGVTLGFILALGVLVVERGSRMALTGRRLTRIFAGDPTIVPPAPAGASHRMPCALFLSRRLLCAGVLYVTRDSFVFQPNYPHKPWWKSGTRVSPDSLAMGPARTLTVAEGFLKGDRWWIRRLGLQPVPALICSWEDGLAALRVPRTSFVIDALQEHIDRMRAGIQEVV